MKIESKEIFELLLENSDQVGIDFGEDDIDICEIHKYIIFQPHRTISPKLLTRYEYDNQIENDDDWEKEEFVNELLRRKGNEERG